ncbi:hypothetical protein ACP70R_019041 [Stipagrostis hirtigluma subsp. patula]
MAEKEHTLVITLNRSCCRCFTKIRKTLCKLQETEDIRAITYDEKSGTVTISGPFDPLVLPCKLRCKAGCVIRDIHLKEKSAKKKPEDKPPTPPPAQPPTPQKPACPPAPACSCHGGVCHCGGYGYHYGWCCCSACAAPPAPPCYGQPYGGCSKIQIVTCDSDMPPACSIM